MVGVNQEKPGSNASKKRPADAKFNRRQSLGQREPASKDQGKPGVASP